MYTVTVMTMFVSMLDGATCLADASTLKKAIKDFQRISKREFKEVYDIIDGYFYDTYENENNFPDEYSTVLVLGVFNNERECILSRNFDYNPVKKIMDQKFEIEIDYDILNELEKKTLVELGY
ncbi:MAG: hypothetical protein WCL51_01310 [Bacteroidota bacterium]